MQIINLTPHNIVFCGGWGTVEYPADGTVARVEMTQREWTVWVGTVEQKFKTRPTPKGTVGLPPQNEGIFYIVSSMVREANFHRLDLISPADLVRDERGAVVGCKSFDTNYLASPIEYGGHGI